ncbi:hypothetical protein PINS_up017947 [Pythium insidiosum]|nr:hypothetical protein PINS_up017947 [Pythium insidiosum]
MYWHPREKQYSLRFSIDGIFYGLRDFLIESLVGTFAMHVSHQTNGAQGVTPTCKVQLKGHTVARGAARQGRRRARHDRPQDDLGPHARRHGL